MAEEDVIFALQTGCSTSCGRTTLSSLASGGGRPSNRHRSGDVGSLAPVQSCRAAAGLAGWVANHPCVVLDLASHRLQCSSPSSMPTLPHEFYANIASHGN